MFGSSGFLCNLGFAGHTCPSGWCQGRAKRHRNDMYLYWRCLNRIEHTKYDSLAFHYLDAR